MKRYQICWLAVLAVLAVNLQDASAQFESTMITRRNTITSTMTSFTNNINNKVTDYTNKLNSLRNDMTSQLNSASQTITTFLSDAVIGANALLVSDMVATARTNLATSITAAIDIAGTFSTVADCVNVKTQESVNVTFEALVTANTEFTIILARSTSSFVSTCRSRYSSMTNSLVNQYADRQQECLNGESTELNRVSTILNNYMTIMRTNFQRLANNVRYCTGLGGTSSRGEVKAEISACLEALSSYVAPIYTANIEQQFVVATSMLQLEVVASNNRVRSCINQVIATYTAMAEAVPSTLETCLATGQ